MATEIYVAALAFLGTCVGSVGGIMAANKLTNYRIQQLENKVSKHNDLIDRMYAQEARTDVLEEKMRVANHRIDDLEKNDMTA